MEKNILKEVLELTSVYLLVFWLLILVYVISIPLPVLPTFPDFNSEAKFWKESRASLEKEEKMLKKIDQHLLEIIMR